MQLKQELMELSIKIGETNLNQSDLFTEENHLYSTEGLLFILEGDHYIVGVERGKINSEKNLIIRKIFFIIFAIILLE